MKPRTTARRAINASDLNRVHGLTDQRKAIRCHAEKPLVAEQPMISPPQLVLDPR